MTDEARPRTEADEPPGHEMIDEPSEEWVRGYIAGREAAIPDSRLRAAFESGWWARHHQGEHVGSDRAYAAVPINPEISHDESCCAARGCHLVCSHLCGTDLHICDGTDHSRAVLWDEAITGATPEENGLSSSGAALSPEGRQEPDR